jgi:phage terminase large subunit-like protein
MELNNMKKIINTPQGIQELDLTTEEIAQREQDAIQAEQDKANKQSAINKLKALGLTDAEVEAFRK